MSRSRYQPAYDAADELGKVWDDADKDAKDYRPVAPEVDFESTVTPVEGVVDYHEIKWESFSQVIETSERFTFYSGRSISKVIAKSQFSDHQEVAALRLVIRRHVENSELLDD